MVCSYNKSQQDALFLVLILIYNSRCFGQTYCPSSGVLILYSQQLVFVLLSGVPRNFVWGGFNKFSCEDRDKWDLGGGSPLVRGCGGSCNLVQEISFHIVKFS